MNGLTPSPYQQTERRRDLLGRQIYHLEQISHQNFQVVQQMPIDTPFQERATILERVNALQVEINRLQQEQQGIIDDMFIYAAQRPMMVIPPLTPGGVDFPQVTLQIPL